MKRQQREKAAKTLKKGKKFGFQKSEENFEWPKEADIVAMPLDKPVKVVSVSFRTWKDTSNGDYISEIQLHLSNGASSPIFKGSRTTDISEVKTVQLGDVAKLRKVEGTL